MVVSSAQNKEAVDKSSAMSQQPVKAKKKIPLPLIVLLIGAIAIVVYWYFTRPIQSNKSVYVSGRIEGYETNVGAKIGGRVDYIAVREGDYVTKGQLIVKVSDADIQAQLRGAQARFLKANEQAETSRYQIEVVESQINEATLKVTQSKEDSSSQVDEAEAKVAEARAKLSQAKAELIQAKSDLGLAQIRKERYEMLEKRGAVTTDESDQARTTCSTDTAIVEAKEQALIAARKDLTASISALNQARATLFNPGIQKAQLISLQKQLVQARYQLKSALQDIANAKADEDQIKANIAYLTILSPINAICTARTVEPGAVVAPGQTVLSIIDLDTVYLRGYVPDSQIGRVRVGQKAKVILDSSIHKPLEGTVTEIDPEASFTPENIYFRDDRVKQVFGIKITIIQPDRFAKPGMPADADIAIDSPR